MFELSLLMFELSLLLYLIGMYGVYRYSNRSANKKRVPSPFYLLDKGVIDKDEFKSMKQKIINKL